MGTAGDGAQGPPMGTESALDDLLPPMHLIAGESHGGRTAPRRFARYRGHTTNVPAERTAQRVRRTSEEHTVQQCHYVANVP